MYVRDPATAKIGKEILTLEVGYLPEFFQQKAIAELHDTPENRIQGMRQIRELIQNERLMSQLDLSDDFILQNLRVRKFNVTRAFHHLKAYVNLRHKHPEMFSELQYELTVKSMENQFVSVLPYRCQDGCAIIVTEVDNWNPETFSVEELKKVLVVYLLGALQDPMTQVNGFKIIIDVECNSIRYLRFCTPQNLYILYHGTQECCPSRYKEIHIVNTSMAFRVAWMVAKPFFSDKVRKRFHFHANYKTLLNHFPTSVLPVKYGGDLKDYAMTGWLKRIMEPDSISKMFGEELKV